MLESPRSLGTLISRSRVRLVAGTALAFALSAALAAPVPARAITTQTEAKLTETQKRVEDSAEAYDTATKSLEKLQQQIAENEADIADIEAKMPDAKASASSAMRELYKYRKGTNTAMSFVLQSEDLDELITNLKYMDQVESSNVRALERLNDMQQELEQKQAQLTQAKAQAETEQQNAQSALAEAQQLREQAQEEADAEAAAEAAELAAQQQAAADAAQGSTPVSTAPVNSGSVNWNTDEATFVAEWAGRIDAYLAGSPLAGQGGAFTRAAWKYGVDPRFSPAISNTESSKGAACFKPYNAWGWGSSSWSSWEEAIDAHVSGLARGYGHTITLAAAKKYCPPNYVNWYNNTLSEMNRI